MKIQSQGKSFLSKALTCTFSIVALLGVASCSTALHPVDGTVGNHPAIQEGQNYPLPKDDAKTAHGEKVKDAEARFIHYAAESAQHGETNDELLYEGYKTCGYFMASSDFLSFYDKIHDDSAGDKAKEDSLIEMSAYASQTICPEFEDFESPNEKV
jgi:hypothetical protein